MCAMATTTKSTVRVYDYQEGTHLGRAEITRDAIEKYLESAQWPQGIIAAGDVLSGGDRDRLGITSGQTIWLEDTAP